ncbi:MAG: GGDEF domain-containing protein [Cellulosilyticum sp.]|nr:GGDEF domain-containing protein [Cellulosilyticum sp.]
MNRGMEMWFRLQTNLICVALLGIILGHIHISRRDQERTDKVLRYIMELDLLLLVLEIIRTYISGSDVSWHKTLHKAAMIFIFLLIPVIMMTAPAFLLAWMEKTTKIKKYLNPILYIPVVFNGILTIFTIQTQWLGYINERNEYVRGPLFGCVLVNYLIYLIYTMGIMKKYGKYMLKNHRYVVYNISLVMCIAVSLQMNEQSVLTIWSTVGILCVCAYTFMIYYNWLHDPLTGVESRVGYSQYIKHIENRKSVKLTAINIDLDDFKQINDQYGHQEGDWALISFTQILRDYIQIDKKVIRIGGDEFLIFIENCNETKIIEQLERVKAAITDFNLKNHKGYELKFSYGILEYQKERENIKQFLIRLDKLMYEQKNKKKYKSK